MKTLEKGNLEDQSNLAVLTREHALVEAARRDPEAFGQLYEQNFDRVYAFLAHRLTTREEAQDLTAEVFHQALASLEGYEFRGRPLIAWLLGIAANLLAQHWQHSGRRQEISADDLELAAADTGIDRRRLLAQIVDQLPEHQRRVIVGRFTEEKSIREIAQQLGRSEGAIKQLQLRALQNLRARIKEWS